MTNNTKPKTRQRGSIEALNSGSLRVKVYAGQDPLSQKRHYLEETVQLPANASVKDVKAAWKKAEQIRQGFIKEIDDRRNPRTKATVNQMLDRYLDPRTGNSRITTRTRENYKSLAANHIRSLIGDLPLIKLDETLFDSFYGQLQTCHHHGCDGSPNSDHDCEPLSAESVRLVHTILSGALKRAVRWKWISLSPIVYADPPPPNPPDPNPPTNTEMAKLLHTAWNQDPSWGMLIWMAMRTGARRGEICAWSWDRLDLDAGLLRIDTAIVQEKGRTWEGPTKTQRKRRIALNEIDIGLLRAYWQYRQEAAMQVGVTIDPKGRLFSPNPDHKGWYRPDSLTQRFAKLRDKLEINTDLKRLRHYSATELIAAGVDIRTVAGRLGHSGGGTTTLKVYSAFLNEADQRAADLTSTRMPDAPVAAQRLIAREPKPALPEEPEAPYEHIATDLAGAIRCGVLATGDRLPNQANLASHYNVAGSTINRAFDVLKRDGLITASRGAPARVADPAT